MWQTASGGCRGGRSTRRSSSGAVGRRQLPARRAARSASDAIRPAVAREDRGRRRARRRRRASASPRSSVAASSYRHSCATRRGDRRAERAAEAEHDAVAASPPRRRGRRPALPARGAPRPAAASGPDGARRRASAPTASARPTRRRAPADPRRALPRRRRRRRRARSSTVARAGTPESRTAPIAAASTPLECAKPPVGVRASASSRSSISDSLEPLEQRVALGQRQLGDGSGLDRVAVDRDDERLRIDGDRGSASLPTICALPTARVSPTTASARRNSSRSASPCSSAAGATQEIDISGATEGSAPNIGRWRTGCGVGIEALASPIGAETTRRP